MSSKTKVMKMDSDMRRLFKKAKKDRKQILKERKDYLTKYKD